MTTMSGGTPHDARPVEQRAEGAHELLGLVGAMSHPRTLEHQEHTGNIVRMRQAMKAGLFLWPFLMIADVIVCTWIHPTSFWGFFCLRLTGWLAILYGHFSLRPEREQQPSPEELRFLGILVWCTLSTALGAMTILSGGLNSPYGRGIPVLLAFRAFTTTDHWRTAIFTIGLPAVCNTLAVLGLVSLTPELSPQLHDFSSLSHFIEVQWIGWGTAGMLIFGSHWAYSLKRQVHAAQDVGRYRLKRRIGSGGMGEVWLAYHTSLKRDVAVKLLRHDARTGPVAVARFEREVRATAELTHPNTVRVFDYGVTDGGIWYYAMEYLTGETLTSLVRREGPLDPERALRFMKQAADALAEAHGRGIIHRDIKPDNLFVTTMGGVADQIKVLDFGVASVAWEDDALALTRTGGVVGTPVYMAPEIGAGRPASTASDVYSLGAVGYFLLTGEKPFDAPSASAVFLAQMTQEVAPPSAVRPGLNAPELERVIMQCLARSEGNRFSSAQELVEALDASVRFSIAPAPKADEVGEFETTRRERNANSLVIKKKDLHRGDSEPLVEENVQIDA